MPTRLSFSQSLIEVTSHASHYLSTRTAPDQGGLLSGQNPAAVNNSDPIRLWVIQVALIITFTQLLALALGRIRQPKVIAEVIGGIILGPTAMGHVPGFTNNIFPAASIVNLNLTANIGLVLFLFLVGLEVDMRLIRRNARSSLTISAAGMILPFSLGAAIAVPMYARFINHQAVSFGHYLLFSGVAMSITAFPVLCRILTELKLLHTTVGSIVLAAGVGNDVVGWILLALTVALVNAGTGIEALYVLLCTVGWAIFLLVPVKWVFRYLCRKTGSFENGPTPFIMTLTILIVFASAFFTDVIGVHAIFGGFLAGLMIPHDGGFNIALVEKFEDLVSLLFLPLYFAYTGLNTNLSSLNTAIDWGYIIAVIMLAFVGKFGGCAIAATFAGYKWREAGAIGTLMSCKGLVELIVLNVGLQAGILDVEVFSMFVVEALTLTFMTTPLTLLFYPERFHRPMDASLQPAVSKSDAEKPDAARPGAAGYVSGREDYLKTRICVVLNKMEHLPALMTLTALLQSPPTRDQSTFGNPSSGDLSEKLSTPETTPKAVDQFLQPSSQVPSDPSPLPVLKTAPVPRSGAVSSQQIQIDALRLIELTDRASALMKSSVTDELIRLDPLVNVFRTYGHLNRIPVSVSLSVVAYDQFASSILSHAKEHDSQLVLIPWGPQAMGSAVLEQENSLTGPSATTTHSSPFASIFSGSSSAIAPTDAPSSLLYSQLARRVFSEAPCDTGLFIDRGLAPTETAGGYGQHIFLPFFGGPDDRLALATVVQLCGHPGITATIVRVTKTDEPTDTDLATPAPTHISDEGSRSPLHHTEAISHTFSNQLTSHSGQGFPDTVYGHATTQTRLASNAADDLAWGHFAEAGSEKSSRSPLMTDALARITFDTITSSIPLHVLMTRAQNESEGRGGLWKSLLLVVGRGRRMALESHHTELNSIISEADTAQTSINSDIRKTIGDVAAAFVVSGSKASLLVMQSADSRPGDF